MVIIIKEIGKRTKDSTDFGYRVTNSVTGYRHLDYENRARLVSGQYLLEERSHINVRLSPFIAATATKGYKKADKILYGLANQAVKKTLEALVPRIIDETQMSKELKEKHSTRRKK